MPAPSELLRGGVVVADRRKLEELGRIIDSLYAPTAPAVAVFPGGGSLLMVPGTLSVNSANNPDGNHTHAIATSSNPGASAAILATDVSGALTLRSLNIGAAVDAVPGEVRASVGFAARTDDAAGGLFAGAASDVQWRWGGANLWDTPDAVHTTGNIVIGGGGVLKITERAHLLLDDASAFLQNLAGVAAMAVVTSNAWWDSTNYRRLVARNAANALQLESDGSFGFYTAVDAGSTVDSNITFYKVASVSQFIDSLVDGSVGGFRAGALSDVQWWREAAGLWRAPNEIQVGSGAATAKVGSWVGAATTHMAIAHASVFGTVQSYALLQGSSGDTYLNSASGQALTFRINNANVGVFTTAGQLQVPTAGIGAGVLVGTSVQWYEDGINLWRTPDSVTIDGGLNLGSGVGSLPGEITSVGSVTGGMLWWARNTDSTFVSTTRLVLQNDGTSSIQTLATSTNYTPDGVILPNTGGVLSDFPFGMWLAATATNAFIAFAVGSTAEKMRLTAAGLNVNLGLNIGSASGAATGEARASVGFAARVDGSGGGFWAGAASDVQLFRGAANTWYTGSGDGLYVDQGNLTLVTGADAASFLITGNAASNRSINFQTGGVNRWIVRVNSTAEGGANAGSDFAINARADDGSSIGDVLFLQRASRNMGLFGVTAFGTSAAGVLGIANAGTVPGSSPANMIQLYSKDSSVGAVNATLALRTEQGVEVIGTFTPSHKLRVWINEVEYWVQLDAV